jgi:hypothetical protein
LLQSPIFFRLIAQIILVNLSFHGSAEVSILFQWPEVLFVFRISVGFILLGLKEQIFFPTSLI